MESQQSTTETVKMERDLIESVSVWVVCVSGFSFPFHVGAVFVSSSLCVQF